MAVEVWRRALHGHGEVSVTFRVGEATIDARYGKPLGASLVAALVLAVSSLSGCSGGAPAPPLVPAVPTCTVALRPTGAGASRPRVRLASLLREMVDLGALAQPPPWPFRSHLASSVDPRPRSLGSAPTRGSGTGTGATSRT